MVFGTDNREENVQAKGDRDRTIMQTSGCEIKKNCTHKRQDQAASHQMEKKNRGKYFVDLLKWVNKQSV